MNRYTMTITARNAADMQKHIHVDDVLSFFWEWEQFMRSKAKYEDGEQFAWDDLREQYYRLKGEHSGLLSIEEK